MSVSSLPEWKQLLLDRKRRGEEARGRQEQEEEKRLATMPAWKRGIIQRRRAKQDFGVSSWTVDTSVEVECSTSGSLAATYSSSRRLSVDGPEPQSQVLAETIGPVRQNPFIRSQCAWRAKRRGSGEDIVPDVGAEWEGEVRKTDVCWREGCYSRAPAQEHGKEEQGTCRETRAGIVVKEREKDCFRGRSEGERGRGTVPLYQLPLQGLRTTQAENILIVEKERGGAEKEEQSRRKKEGKTEAEQGNDGRTLDSGDIFVAKGNVMGIGALQGSVLKPLAGVKDRVITHRGRHKEEDEEMGRRVKGESGVNAGVVQVSRCERGAEAGGSTGIGTAVPESRPAERLGRVSQLVSKFGELRKTPQRSRSTDHSVCPDGFEERQEEEEQRRASGIEEDWSEGREGGREPKDTTFRGIPKCLFAFSERVTLDTDSGGVCDKDDTKKEVTERMYCDRRAPQKRGYWQSVGVKSGAQENLGMECEGWPQAPAQGEARRHKQTQAEEEMDAEEKVNCRRMEKALGRERERVVETSPPRDEDEDSQRGTVAAEGPERTEGIADLATGVTAASTACSKREDERKMEREQEVAQEMQRERQTSLHREGESVTTRRTRGTEAIALEAMELHRNIPAVRGEERLFKENRPGSLSSAQSTASATRSTSKQRGVERLSPRLRGHLSSEVGDCAGNAIVLKEKELERGGVEGSSKAAANKDGQEDVGGAVSGQQTPAECGTEHSHTKRDPDGLDEPAASRVEFQQPGHFSVTREVQMPAEGQDRGRGQSGHSRAVEVRQCQGKVAEQTCCRETVLLLTGDELLVGKVKQGELVPQQQLEGQAQLGNWLEEQEGLICNVECVKREKQHEGKTEVEKEQRVREMAERQPVSRERKESTTATESEREEQVQDGPRPSTSSTLDVRQEAVRCKPRPPLPASVSPSRLPLAVGEDNRGALSAPHLCPQERQEEEGQHVEELGRGWHRRRFAHSGGREEKEEEESAEEDNSRQGFSPPLSSTSHSSPLSPSSPPLPSAGNMSRIYNLKPVVPRATLSVGEKKIDPPSPSLKPEVQELRPQFCRPQPPQDRLVYRGETREQEEAKPSWQQLHRRRMREEADSKVKAVPLEDAGVRTVQQQVELLKIRTEPQAQSNRPLEVGAQQQRHEGSPLEERVSPRRPQLAQQHPDQSTQLKEKGAVNQKVTTQQLQSQQPLQQAEQSHSSRTFTVDPKPRCTVETTPSSNAECGGAASPSPTSSPSCTPSTALFTLRSSSAMQAKRGNTFTITPRRAPVATQSVAAPQVQTSAPDNKGDAGKKRYPTVDEIKVIGGYQTLEKSCLTKHKRSPKKVKVCFNDTQLEHLCEYPSEGSLLASLPNSSPEAEEEPKEQVVGQEEEDEEEEEAGAFVSSVSGRVGPGAKRVLRVDESCRL